MKTAFILMAQYDGKAVVPIEDVCRDYFAPLTVEQFLRKSLAGEIKLPVVRMANGGDGIQIEELCRYINDRVEVARSELDAAMRKREEDARALAAALAEPPKTVTIYFIECGGHVKIGMTTGQVERRLQTLATSHFQEMRILATLDNVPASLESQLHDRFDADRVRGEWFRLTDEILEYIETAKRGEVR